MNAKRRYHKGKSYNRRRSVSIRERSKSNRKIPAWISRALPRRPVFSWKMQVSLVVGFSFLAAISAIMLKEWILQLGSWGYLGAFVINAVSSATIFFPAPGAVIIMVMAQDYNPFILGSIAGLGGAMGSITSYLLGRLATSSLQKGRMYGVARWAMGRFGGVILFVFSLVPFLPMDSAGLLAGATRYPLIRFYFYVGIASMIKMVGIIYIASTSLNEFQQWLKIWGLDVSGINLP